MAVQSIFPYNTIFIFFRMSLNGSWKKVSSSNDEAFAKAIEVCRNFTLILN